MFKKIVDFKTVYTIHTVRVTVLAIFASLAVYNLGLLSPDYISPSIAAIIALTSMKATFYDTVRESIKQVLGTTSGALLGITLITYIGFNSVSLMVIVIVSMLIGWVLKLNAQGGLMIAATVILVAGPLLGDLNLIEERVAGVILGALGALVASMFIKPYNPHNKLLSESISLGKENTKILEVIAKEMKENKVNLDKISQWEVDVKVLADKINYVRNEIKAIEKDARWSPMVKLSSVESVNNQSKITKNNIFNVKTIVASLENFYLQESELTNDDAEKISKMLSEASHAMSSQLKIAATAPSTLLGEDAANAIRRRRRKLADRVKNMDNTQAILLSGTLMHEITNIKNAITED
jgi:uncharacterized membrane protein YgaE (UPF0421/DUF939 family)